MLLAAMPYAMRCCCCLRRRHAAYALRAMLMFDACQIFRRVDCRDALLRFAADVAPAVVRAMKAMRHEQRAILPAHA